MVNYIWIITKLDTRPTVNNLINVVSGAHWTLTGTKEYEGTTYAANMSGVTSFSDPDSNNFIDYSQITFENIVQWLEQSIGEEPLATLKNDLEMSIDNTIQQILYPTYINLPLPWETQTI